MSVQCSTDTAVIGRLIVFSAETAATAGARAMATVTFNIPIDMRTFAGYDFTSQTGGGAHGSQGDTTYSWHTQAGFYYTTSGTALSGGTIFPANGTVTGWDFGITQFQPNSSDPYHPIEGGYSYWNFVGLSVPAADFRNAVSFDGATLAAYMPTMLAGTDTISGSAYDDYLLGFEGNDTLKGNAGTDGLEGGAGNDMLNGGIGADTMIGGVGNDTYFVDNSGDKVIEDASAGVDLVKSSITYTLGVNVENLTLTGTAAINGTGNVLPNVITGNGAANTLGGSGGNDVVHGGGGNDTLGGGSGNDTLDGAAGLDHFLFNAALNASTNVDNIKDFSVTDDTIDLDRTIFTQLTTLGTLGAAGFFTGSSAHDADDRIIYDSGTGNIYYDPDGNGPAAQVLFAHLTAGMALTNADFLIVA